MAIITVPITYIDGVDVVHGQDITDTQETAIDAREKALMSIVSVSMDDTTGVFTFTRANGSTFTLDTLLEKVVTNFTYDSTTQELVLTLEDGTTQRIPMSAFIDVYTGVDGDMITVSVSSGNAISAVIKDGTITKAKLVSAVQTSLGKADTALQPTDIVDNLTSTATTAPLSANQGKQLNDNKQDKITSTNKLNADLLEDGTTNKVFTATEKSKLANIEAGAEANVQSDWTQSDNTADDFIKNKPTIPTKDSDLTTDRYVRYDINSQGLSATEQSNGRINLGLGSASTKNTGYLEGNIPELETYGKLNPSAIPQATSNTIGGIKADAKTSSDTQEVHIDPTTGKLYTQPSGGGSSVTVEDNLTSTSTTNALSANQGRVLDNKKVEKTNGTSKLYGTDSGGNETTYTVGSSNIDSDSGILANKVHIFVDGRTKVKTPTDDYHTANKKYVDSVKPIIRRWS